MTFHFKISLLISKFDKSYHDQIYYLKFKYKSAVETQLNNCYAIAKKGQVDKYSKIFGLFGNLGIRVCQGPSTCTIHNAPEPLNTGTLGTRLRPMPKSFKDGCSGFHLAEHSHTQF